MTNSVGLHPEIIKAELRIYGASQSSIAREMKVSHVSVLRVIDGMSRSARIERRIAELLGRQPWQLWPQWYAPPTASATASAGTQGNAHRAQPGGVTYLLPKRGRDSVAELLRAGALVAQIKEREPAGEFYRALERSGIAVRFASRAMRFAQAFGLSPSRHQLAHQLGVSKALCLLHASCAEIDALAAGQTVRGHTAEQLARMTTREFAALFKREQAHASGLSSSADAAAEEAPTLGGVARSTASDTDRTNPSALAEVAAHRVKCARGLAHALTHTSPAGQAAVVDALTALLEESERLVGIVAAELAARQSAQGSRA